MQNIKRITGIRLICKEYKYERQLQELKISKIPLQCYPGEMVRLTFT